MNIGNKSGPVDFFRNGLCAHCYLAQQELNEFRAYHEASELSWGDRDRQVREHLDSVLQKYPQSSHSEVVESYGWDLHVNQVKYPGIHRQSIILTIFSFLEYEVNGLCDILSGSVSSSVLLRDLSGRGVERAFLYLRKIAAFDMSAMGVEMAYIRGINSVRNQVVHNGGVLPEEVNHKANVFVASCSHLGGEPGRPVQVHEQFVPELIETLVRFFEKLEGQVQAHIEVYNRGA